MTTQTRIPISCIARAPFTDAVGFGDRLTLSVVVDAAPLEVLVEFETVNVRLNPKVCVEKGPGPQNVLFALEGPDVTL